MLSLNINTKWPLCFSGSHGCHLFSTEPEDESASAGACGSFQSSPETQHEETHLNRHVDTHTHIARPPVLTSPSVGLIRKHRQSPGQSDLLSPFLIYLFVTPNICTHTHPSCTLDDAALWRRQLKRKRGNSQICYCWGDRLVFISTAFICTCPLRLSFFRPRRRKKCTSWCSPSLWLADSKLLR